MRNHPVARPLSTASAKRSVKTRANLKRCYQAGRKAALRGAAISTCNYAAPNRVAAWIAGWESIVRPHPKPCPAVEAADASF